MFNKICTILVTNKNVTYYFSTWPISPLISILRLCLFVYRDITSSSGDSPALGGAGYWWPDNKGSQEVGLEFWLTFYY